MIIAILLTLAGVLPGSASATPSSPMPSEYCEADRLIANQAWSAYIAKTTLSPDQKLTFGARIMAAAALLVPCPQTVSEPKRTIQVGRLLPSEIELLKKFIPHGDMTAFARCLVTTDRAKALTYLQATDQKAFDVYMTTKRVGAFDESAFRAIAQGNACAASFPKRVDTQRFYIDLNWFARVQPMLAKIVDWHLDKSNA